MIRLRLGMARRTLPLGRDESIAFLPWVLALMVYVAGLSGVGLAVLEDAVRASQESAAGRMTVQVPAEVSDARLQTVLAVLRQTPGVRSVELLNPAATARLLEPWLGSPLSLDELPVPRLIDIDGSVDLPTLRRQLTSIVPDARFEDHHASTGGPHRAALSVRAVLAALIAVPLVLIALSAVFATRTALAIRGPEVELFHLLGAADHDIARPFAVRAFRTGLFGGLLGAIAALLTAVGLGRGDALVDLPGPIGPAALADWRLWAILTGLVVSAGLVAMAAAQIVVLRRLAQRP